MAITPYTQRTRAPSVGQAGIPSLTSTQQPDIGPAIQGLGNAIAGEMEPHLRQKAIEQAKADFAAQGLGRDAQGNYTMPTPDGGGLIYQQAYQQVAEAQFLQMTEIDVVDRLSEIYNENPLGDADVLYERAQGLVKGTIDSSPDGAKPALITALSRQLSMFDRNKRVEDVNIDLRQKRETAQVVATKWEGEYEGLAWQGTGTPEWETQLSVYKDKLEDNLAMQVQLEMISAEEAQIKLDRYDSISRMGMFMSGVRAEVGTRSANETEMLGKLLLGQIESGTEAYGYTEDSLNEMDLTQGDRNELGRRILNMAGDMAKKEEDLRKGMEMQELLDAALADPNQFAQYSSTDQNGVAALLISQYGVDPYSPEAATILFNAFDRVPTDFYKAHLGGLAGLDFQAIEQRMPLLEQFRQMTGPDGQPQDLTGSVLSGDDLEFYDVYRTMRQSTGGGEQDRLEVFSLAKETYRAVKGTSRADRQTILLEKSGKANWAEAEDEIQSLTGLPSFEHIGPAAKQWMMDYAGVLVASGNYTFDEAIKTAGRRVEANWTQSQFDVTYRGQRIKTSEPIEALWGLEVPTKLIEINDRRRGGWVPKSEEPPAVGNRSSTIRYQVTAVDHALENLADLSNIGQNVTADDLRLGSNVARRFAGRGPNGSMEYTLWYMPDAKRPPVPIMSKDGGILRIDLGKAGQAQSEYNNTFRINVAQSEKWLSQQLEELKGEKNAGLRQQLIQQHFKRYAIPPNVSNFAKDVRAMVQDAWRVGGSKITRQMDTVGFKEWKVEDYAPRNYQRIVSETIEEEVSRVKERVGYTPVNNNSRRAYNHLYKSGMFDRLDSIAMIAALQGESGVDFAARNTYGDKHLGAGQEAIGMAQWRLERRDAFKTFAGMSIEEANKKPNWLELQLGFAMHELKTTHKSAYQRLKRARTLDEKLKVLMQPPGQGGYLGTVLDGEEGKKNYARRLGYARVLAAGLGN